MGKRIKRYLRPHLEENFEKLKEVPLTLITREGRSYFGSIKSVQKDTLIFFDKRRHKHIFEFNSVLALDTDIPA